MPIPNPGQKRVELYDVVEKRQYLADISDFNNSAPIAPYLGTAVTPIAVTANTPVTLVFTPAFDPRATADPLVPPGFYNVVFAMTATVDHDTGDPNERYGAKIKATMTAGAATARDQAAVVFDGEEFQLRIVRGFQLADTEGIVVELVCDVDATITPSEAFLQAVYLSA